MKGDYFLTDLRWRKNVVDNGHFRWRNRSTFFVSRFYTSYQFRGLFQLYGSRSKGWVFVRQKMDHTEKTQSWTGAKTGLERLLVKIWLVPPKELLWTHVPLFLGSVWREQLCCFIHVSQKKVKAWKQPLDISSSSMGLLCRLFQSILKGTSFSACPQPLVMPISSRYVQCCNSSRSPDRFYSEVKLSGPCEATRILRLI